MNRSDIARVLGRKGGVVRARRLSADERRRIAAMGARARLRSLEAARRIDANLQYAAAIDQLRGGRPTVQRSSTFGGPLPGTHPAGGHGRPR